MARTEQQAHGVRRHQSHEADQAANRDGSSGEQRTDDDDKQLAALNMKPQVRRALFTKRKNIQHSSKRTRVGNTRDDDNGHNNYGGPTGYSDTTGKPVKQCLDAERR